MSFKHLFAFEPGITPVGVASFGDSPIAVAQYDEELRQRRNLNQQGFFWEEAGQLLEASRLAAAEFLHADPEGFVLVDNVVEALNSVLGSLRDAHHFVPGDEILVTSHVYPSYQEVLEHFAKVNGLTVKVAQIPFPINSKEDVIAGVKNALTGKTRFAVIEHITSQTALLLPVQDIVALLNDRNILTFVDAAHAPGQLAVDVTDIGAAFYGAGLSKWTYAPSSVAGLYVAPDYRDMVYPCNPSGGCSSEKFVERFGWMGTRDRVAAMCLPKAIDYISSLFPQGWQDIYERNHDLAVEARNHLCRELNIQPACPDDMMGMFFVLPLGKMDFRDPAINAMPLHLRLRRFLRAEGLEGLATTLDGENHLLRVAVRIHNDMEDYIMLGQAVKKLWAEYGFPAPETRQIGLAP